MLEYKFVPCKIDTLFSVANYQELIIEHAKEGWKFVQMVQTQFNTEGKPKKFELIFEREVEDSRY